MTELEWLRQESGLTDEELKTYETILGDGKFKAMLRKVIAANEGLTAAKTKAEGELEQFTTRYNSEFVPAMATVTKESLEKAGEVASLRAKLAKAQEYGIVLADDKVDDKKDQPRAPGSPDPNAVTRDDFGRFSNAQANTVMALQELNADNFELFGKPLSGTGDLVTEVNRQHLLGNKAFTLRNAWEVKNNVAAKRTEIQAANQKKHDDEIRAGAIREEREKNGANPNLRSGRTSRYATYKAGEASSDKKPWQSSHGRNERNAPWRENARAKLREVAAA
jgi:hypothetical protein